MGDHNPQGGAVMVSVVYAYPFAALLFLLTPVWVVLFCALYRHREQVLKEFGGQIGMLRRSRRSYVLKGALVCASWMLISLALMEPSVRSIRVVDTKAADVDLSTGMTAQSQRLPHDILLMLDLSRSMAVRDTELGQSRFQLAKETFEELIRKLPGDSIALYPFTRHLDPLVPPTFDHLYLRMRLRDLEKQDAEGSGTDLVSVMSELSEQLNISSDKLTTVVLISDGGDTLYEAAEGNLREYRLESIKGALPKDRERLAVLTVGVGSVDGSIIPEFEYHGAPVHSSLLEDPLRVLAEAGAGVYYGSDRTTSLSLAEDLAAWIQQRIEREARKLPDGRLPVLGLTTVGHEDVVIDPLYRWCLALALLLLMCSQLLPDAASREVL